MKKRLKPENKTDMWVIINPDLEDVAFTAGSDITTCFVHLAEVFPSKKKAIKAQEKWCWKDRGYTSVRPLRLEEIDPRKVFAGVIEMLRRQNDIQPDDIGDDEPKNMLINLIDRIRNRAMKPLARELILLKAKMYDIEHGIKEDE